MSIDSDNIHGQSEVEHTGEFAIEDVPREPGAYRPHRHFLIAYKERTEVTGDLINTLITEGNLYYANGENRFLFVNDICGVQFWLIVVMKPDESKHMVLTAYSPELHDAGEKWQP